MQSQARTIALIAFEEEEIDVTSLGLVTNADIYTHGSLLLGIPHLNINSSQINLLHTLRQMLNNDFINVLPEMRKGTMGCIDLHEFLYLRKV